MKSNFEDKKLSTMAPRPINGLYQQFVDNFEKKAKNMKMRIITNEVIHIIHKEVFHNVDKNVNNF